MALKFRTRAALFGTGQSTQAEPTSTTIPPIGAVIPPSTAPPSPGVGWQWVGPNAAYPQGGWIPPGAVLPSNMPSLSYVGIQQQAQQYTAANPYQNQMSLFPSPGASGSPGGWGPSSPGGWGPSSTPSIGPWGGSSSPDGVSILTQPPGWPDSIYWGAMEEQDPSAWTSAVEAQRKQYLTNMQNALAVGADIAAGVFNEQLSLLNGEMTRITAAQGRVNGLWNAWREGALSAIERTAQATRDAYTEYEGLVRQGYSEYDAEVKSRWREYQDKMNRMLNEYMTYTGEDYERAMGRLPKYWQKVVDRISVGDMKAIAHVRKHEVAETDSIAKAVESNSAEFRRAMRVIGADDPGLVDEVMGDLREVAAVAVEQAEYEGLWGTQLQESLGDLARKASRYQVAARLKTLEGQRYSAVMDAERTRYQLQTQSSAQMAQLLEQSGASLEQIIANNDAALQNILNQLDAQEDQVMVAAQEGAEAMFWELSETMRRMQQNYALTAAQRQQGIDSMTWDYYNQYANADALQVGQSEYALSYAANEIARAVDLAGIDETVFDDVAMQTLMADLTAFWTGSADGLQGQRITTFEGFQLHMADLQAAAEAQQAEKVHQLTSSWDEDVARQRGQIAQRLGIAGASSVLDPLDPNTRRFGELSVAESQTLRDALNDIVRQQMIDSGEWPRGIDPWMSNLYRVGFEALNSGSAQWVTDQEQINAPNLAWVLPGVSFDRVSNNFGEWRPITGTSHGGVDINAPAGNPIMAFMGGTIHAIDFQPDPTAGGGVIVDVLGLDNRHYRYAHMFGKGVTYQQALAQLATIGISRGAKVATGQQIGWVGNSGNAFTNHLHFSVTAPGSSIRVNPYPFLAALFTGAPS